MHTITAAYDQLIARFVRWAQTEDNIRAALVIGSRARTDHPADEWSDLDVIILANDPEPYWATADWLHHVGVPWLTFVEPLPDGSGFERRVLFEGGLDVDFVPDPVAPFRQMLEWHTRARQGASVDTWMRGRFLEEWADARAVAALPETFAHYDEPDVWRALQATMTLFRWLTVETAEALGYAYPAFGEARATEIVGRLFNG